MKAPLEERLWRRVIVPNDEDACWEWRGATVAGYGTLGRGARGQGNVLAHRLAYELLVGPIPAEAPHLDHLCRNRLCVNPSHLEAVTQAENNLRMQRDNPRTHCKRGHEFTPENSKPNGNGGKSCRACEPIVSRERRRRNSAKAVTA